MKSRRAAVEPVPTADGPGPIPSFASAKREILLHLKREGEADLEGLSRALGISRMGVYRHVKDLEHGGLVERTSKRTGVGRPRLSLHLAPGASTIFPKAYASLTCSVLQFLEDKMGRKAVEDALRGRQKAVLRSYAPQVTASDLAGRVHQLAKLRSDEGYMAEARGARGGSFELLEYNCPILAVAEQYGEACEVENELFRRILRAEVDTTHRVVAGDHVCRFLIRPRPGGAPE